MLTQYIFGGIVTIATDRGNNMTTSQAKYLAGTIMIAALVVTISIGNHLS